MKHTKGKRNRVRSHHALKVAHFVICSHCRKEKPAHTVCDNCGYYNGRQVVDVLAKLDKKERRKKEKELHAHEEEAAERGKTISAEELSHK
jgi:large subunit ribosomal protein L32